jgi:CheY-like chemotaxis protein
MHADLKPSVPDVTQAHEATTTSGRRVLLAEDNEVNRAILVEMLEVLGYHADAVVDGPAVVESAAGCRYDIILMDCQMPELDGYEATRQIRRAERASGRELAPIVAITGNTGAADRARCLEAGMNDLLPKPFSVGQLHEILKKWGTPGPG